MERRDFLKITTAGASLSAAGLAGVSCGTAPPAGTVSSGGESPDAGLVELAEVALEEAERLGASYADVRIADYQRETLAAREARISSVTSSDDRGFGVRVIQGGTWGFAASPRIHPDELVRVTRRAVELARINGRNQSEPVRLAPNPAHVAVWRTPVRRDPFGVSLEEKTDALLRINAHALGRKGVSFCRSSMDLVGEHKLFASSEGGRIEQRLVRCNPTFQVTHVDRAAGSFETRNSYASPQGRGYEYIEEYPWEEDAERAAEDVVEKAQAPSVEPGAHDLILHPSHLWLTIHESIGHPTEFDRAIGMEANYAGTSFLTPDKLGRERIGSTLVNFMAEKTAPGALATCGYDDDGVETGEWPLVEAGIFTDYQTTREQAHLLDRAASHGCSYAQSWSAVPFQRMPNINLVSPADGPGLAELIADTEDAILIYGRGSYSIDHQRYNFQFGGQTYYRVRGGKVDGMLRDVAYQSRTPDFWRACDAISGPSEYRVHGSFYDGKGEPGQVNAVSHGCSPARFRGIHVLNTGAST